METDCCTNMKSKLEADSYDLVYNQINEMENYFSYLVRTENKYISDEQIDIVRSDLKEIVDQFETSKIDQENGKFVFDKLQYDQKILQLIQKNKKGKTDSDESKREKLQICQNVIGYIDAIIKSINLYYRSRCLVTWSDIYSAIQKIGSIYSEINNNDLERLGYKRNFQNSVDKRNKNSKKFDEAIINFLKKNELQFLLADGKKNYSGMFNVLSSKKNDLEIYLSKLTGYSFTIDTKIDAKGKSFLSFYRDGVKNCYYKVQNPSDYGSKHTQHLSSFFPN